MGLLNSSIPYEDRKSVKRTSNQSRIVTIPGSDQRKPVKPVESGLTTQSGHVVCCMKPQTLFAAVA